MVHDIIQTLPERYRMPLVLHYINGCDVEDVSKILDRSQGTIRKQLQRGIHKVREIMPKYGHRVTSATLIIVLSKITLSAAPMTMSASVSKIILSQNIFSQVAPAMYAQSILSTTKALVASKVFFALVLVVVAPCILYVLWPYVYNAQHHPEPQQNIHMQTPEISQPTIVKVNYDIIHTLQNIQNVELSFSGTRIATYGLPRRGEKSEIHIWNIETQELVERIQVEDKRVMGFKYNEAGTVLYYQTSNSEKKAGSLVARDLIKGIDVFKIQHNTAITSEMYIDTAAGVITAVGREYFDGLKERDLTVMSTKRLRMNENIYYWDMHTGEKVLPVTTYTEGESDWQKNLLKADRQYAIFLEYDTNSARTQWANDQEFTVWDMRYTVWNWPKKKKLYTWERNPMTRGVRCLGWFQQGTKMLNYVLERGKNIGSSEVLDAQTGIVVHSLPGMCLPVIDSKQIVSLRENRIDIYNAKTFGKIKSMKVDVPEIRTLQSIRLSRTGRWLIAMNGKNRREVKVFDLQTEN